MSAAIARAGTALRMHLRRWGMFNAVGVLGVGIQLLTLRLLTASGVLSYMPATAAAVEAAILHNFIWHERWTWSERSRRTIREIWVRLLKFNLSNGMVSLCGNLFLMWVLVGGCGLGYLEANLVAIFVCSVVNYVVSDKFVFAQLEETPHARRRAC